MRAVIYCRVSTHEQNTDNQLSVLQQWCQHRNFDLIDVYQEQETAWKAGHQRELARLVADAYKRKFDVLLVWALDRISRQGALSILEFVHKLNKWGIKTLSYQESWTEAPGELGELLFALTGWVARMESQRRSERTKAGIERSRQDNGHWGRPKGSLDKKKRKRRLKV